MCVPPQLTSGFLWHAWTVRSIRSLSGERINRAFSTNERCSLFCGLDGLDLGSGTKKKKCVCATREIFLSCTTGGGAGGCGCAVAASNQRTCFYQRNKHRNGSERRQAFSSAFWTQIQNRLFRRQDTTARKATVSMAARAENTTRIKPRPRREGLPLSPSPSPSRSLPKAIMARIETYTPITSAPPHHSKMYRVCRRDLAIPRGYGRSEPAGIVTVVVALAPVMALHDTNGHAHKTSGTKNPIHNKVAVGEDDCCFAYAMEVIPMIGGKADWPWHQIFVMTKGRSSSLMRLSKAVVAVMLLFIGNGCLIQ